MRNWVALAVLLLPIAAQAGNLNGIKGADDRVEVWVWRAVGSPIVLFNVSGATIESTPLEGTTQLVESSAIDPSQRAFAVRALHLCLCCRSQVLLVHQESSAETSHSGY